MLYTNLTQKIYWILNFGLMRKPLTDFQLLAEEFKQAPQTIFFLSTGRTATLWFAHLFSKAKGVSAFHEPFPQLHIQSRFAYELWNSQTDEKQVKQILKQIFLAGRTDYLLRAARSQKIYLETNHYLTFFAPVIAELLPNTKFVYIYRHPGDFVRSGIIRGWYDPNNPKTITLPQCNCPQWQKISQIEKLAWLWNETNSFIENFILNLNENKIFKFNFYNIKNPQKIKQLSDFLNIKINEKKINKLIHKAQNKSKNYNIPPYSQWSQTDKEKIKNICHQLAIRQGFRFK